MVSRCPTPPDILVAVKNENRIKEGSNVPRNGEEQFLITLLQFVRAAKGSARPAVKAAARKWESKLVFKIRLISTRANVRVNAPCLRERDLTGFDS